MYSRSVLKTALNGRIHNKQGLLYNVDTTINNAVKEVFANVDIRSSKRKSTLSPKLYDKVYDYSTPSDLKGNKIVDLRPQTDDRERMTEWDLVTPEDFDRRKAGESNLITVDDRDFIKKLRISAELDDDLLTITTFDTTTSSGTWTAFGDGTNLRTDTDNYINGVASLKWDINADGGTTAGVYASDVDDFDLTDYLSAGSFFCWVYITSATNLTNFILRVGSDASNYYSMTATTTNDGSALAVGWQLIRWDLNGRTETGTVDYDDCDYVALYMTKTAGKISEVDYRYDYLVCRNGAYYDVFYYTRYAWQSSGGTYKEESTTDTDYLNVEMDEYNLIIEKVVEMAGYEVREYDDARIAQRRYEDLTDKYLLKHPSEARLMTNEYYHFDYD